MTFEDISARMKQAHARGSDPVAHNREESFRIRARMVGVLLRDARRSVGRSVADCAELLRVPPEQIEAWEYGESVPSLPQLEILAYYLEVPISHFWSTTTLEAQRSTTGDAQTDYVALRDRMIGVLLRLAREQRDLTLDDLAEETGIPADRLARYELGDDPVPMHELSVLSGVVRKNLSYFLEGGSHIGELLSMREEWKQFVTLPEEIRRFAANPLNAGFIEIAIMLSQMPADRLRRIGESVLNITM